MGSLPLKLHLSPNRITQKIVHLKTTCLAQFISKYVLGKTEIKIFLKPEGVEFFFSEQDKCSKCTPKSPANGILCVMMWLGCASILRVTVCSQKKPTRNNLFSLQCICSRCEEMYSVFNAWISNYQTRKRMHIAYSLFRLVPCMLIYAVDLWDYASMMLQLVSKTTWGKKCKKIQMFPFLCAGRWLTRACAPPQPTQSSNNEWTLIHHPAISLAHPLQLAIPLHHGPHHN